MNRIWGAVVVFAVLVLVTPVFAMESADCLGCHAEVSIVGENLTINATAFGGTPHAEAGCPACHAGVSDSHPDDGVAPGKASCGDCHDDVEAEYAGSVHAGNAGCVDCHNPHAVKAQDEVSGYDMNRPCANCHDSHEMVVSHMRWLPQTGTHLSVLPCITCHTGSEKMVLNLYLTREMDKTTEGDFKLASYEDLAALSGGDEPGSLLDRDGNKLVSIEELRNFNRNPNNRDFRLQGMMVPAHQSHSYDILYNRWDCTYCHGTGPQSLQTSFLSFPEPDGSYRRMNVESGAVLSVLYATPDFYMVGATRNSSLNLLGAMILAGGLVMPIGHGFLRFLTRKNRQ
jgi:nitrate/TMAO reductase-like tetraheme cytochrome c subunit